MSRKKPEQPKPEEEFWITTEDGDQIPVAIYKDGEWEIEPGWNTKVKSDERVFAHVDRVITHLLNQGVLPDWLKNPNRFATKCQQEGWDSGGKEANDDSNLRKDVYPKVIKKLLTLLRAHSVQVNLLKGLASLTEKDTE